MKYYSIYSLLSDFNDEGKTRILKSKLFTIGVPGRFGPQDRENRCGDEIILNFSRRTPSRYMERVQVKIV